MKKLFSTILVLALALVLVGCGKTTKAPAGTTKAPAGTTALPAQEYAVKAYIGDELFQSMKVKAGENVSSKLNTPTKDGYAFRGWFLDKELTQAFDVNSAINAATNIYAKFEEVQNDLDVKAVKEEGKTYYLVIGWYGKSETSCVTEAIMKNFYANLITYLTKKGVAKADIDNIQVREYAPSGVNKDLVTELVQDGDVDLLIGAGNALGATTKGNNDETIPLIEKIQIPFDFTPDDDSTGANRMIHRLSNNDIAVNIYGWISNENLNGANAFDLNVQYTADQIILVEDKAQFTVTFMNGEAEYEKQTVVEGSKAVKPATDPTSEGKAFVAWLNAENQPYDFNAEVTENITLHAQFATPYTVTFVEEGKDNVEVVVPDGTTVAKPATDPEKEGYEFVGWFLPDATDAFDFTTPITANITLTATFKEGEYVPTWDDLDLSSGKLVVMVFTKYCSADIKDALETAFNKFLTDNSLTISASFVPFGVKNTSVADMVQGAQDYNAVEGQQADLLLGGGGNILSTKGSTSNATLEASKLADVTIADSSRNLIQFTAAENKGAAELFNRWLRTSDAKAVLNPTA